MSTDPKRTSKRNAKSEPVFGAVMGFGEKIEEFLTQKVVEAERAFRAADEKYEQAVVEKDREANVQAIMESQAALARRDAFQEALDTVTAMIDSRLA